LIIALASSLRLGLRVLRADAYDVKIEDGMEMPAERRFFIREQPFEQQQNCLPWHQVLFRTSSARPPCRQDCSRRWWLPRHCFGDDYYLVVLITLDLSGTYRSYIHAVEVVPLVAGVAADHVGLVGGAADAVHRLLRAQRGRANLCHTET